MPDLYYIGDVCMCEYTSHGHCGILDGTYVDNDKTLEYLAKSALSQVQAGADMVAPSTPALATSSRASGSLRSLGILI